MTIKRWKVGLGVVAAVSVAAVIAGRVLTSRWARNPDPLEGQAVAFPPADERRVELPDGATIATFTLGEGPTIVCVHGLTGSHNDWGPMIPGLVAAGYRIVAIDQRGHGDSTSGTAGYGSAQLGRDLHDVVEELDIVAIAMMGHSMGGMAAMAYAVDHVVDFNKRVGSLILLGTAASLKMRGSAAAFRASRTQIPGWLKPSNRRLRIGAGLSVFGASPSLHMIDQAIVSASRLPESVRAAATFALGDHHVLDRLEQVRCPALVVGGMRDRLIRPWQVRQLAEAIPNAELRMLPKAGHMLIWERHAELVAEVTAFLLGKFPDQN
ncbi:MAG: alpha/beta hydrolase [Acidimicrobiales bacterium]|nr:alpha/beta hydrolase [Acidimicrobiales bacterium]